jgi:hypothetical protein
VVKERKLPLRWTSPGQSCNRLLEAWASLRFPVTMEPPAPCRVITRTPAREIGNPSSARASIRETRIVRPGLFVLPPHKKAPPRMLKDGRRVTTRRRNQLPLSEFDWTPPCGILDSTFFGPRFPWRAFFYPQQGSNWNRLRLFEFESATGHADFSALRFFNLDALRRLPRFVSGGPPQQRASARSPKQKKTSNFGRRNRCAGQQFCY